MEWITNKERQPSEPGSYLVMLIEDNALGWTTEHAIIAEWNFWTDKKNEWTVFDWERADNPSVTGDVAHWMQLPAPPGNQGA